VSTETGLSDNWKEAEPTLLWQTEGLGGGYSSVAILQNKIITLGKTSDGPQIQALDINGGKPLWSTPLGGNTSPNSTPTVDGKLVFALGYDGDLACVQTETGKLVWKKNFLEDFGGRVPTWGYSESPLVDGDLLIVTPGSDESLLVALNKQTGKVVWQTKRPENVASGGHGGAGYASIVISHGGGTKQYVQLVGGGLVGIRASDGKLLWSYARVANGTANIPTPIVQDDLIFCSSGYGTGSALLRLSASGDGVQVQEEYFLAGNKMQNHHGGMILLDGFIYCGHGHNRGLPICIEMMTGKATWGPERGVGGGSAAVVYADGHLYYRYENGVLALVEANPKSYRLKGKFKMASNRGKSWPHPVIAGGRLYLRDQDALLCYDIRRKTRL
tara:strand:- start:2854 stop:4014 length:1161 start_codon:yes stop_codon:yes gene_type:complete